MALPDDASQDVNFSLALSCISHKDAGACRAQACRETTTVLPSFCNEGVILLA